MWNRPAPISLVGAAAHVQSGLSLRHSDWRRGGAPECPDWPVVPRARLPCAISSQAGLIPPLLRMLKESAGPASETVSRTWNQTHASALAMELLVLVADSPELVGRLLAADAVSAVVACLPNPEAVDLTLGGSIEKASLSQSALVVLSNLLRRASSSEGA